MASPSPTRTPPTESALDLSVPFESVTITPSSSPPRDVDPAATGFGPDGTLRDIKRAHRKSGSISRMMGLGGGSSSNRSDEESRSGRSDGSQRPSRQPHDHQRASFSPSLPPSPEPDSVTAFRGSSSLSAPATHPLPTPSPPPPPPPLPETNGSAGSAQHRPSIAGQGNASILEKVLSKTRPHHLPPKDRDEDQKHLRDWERMMTDSKQYDKVRTSTLVQSQASLAQSHEQSLPIWRSTLLPDPHGALEAEIARLASGSQQEKGKGRQLREVWWEGVPPIWRGEVWAKLVGNGLALSERSDYARHVERFDKAIVEGRFPVKALEELEYDAERSWEGLGMFERGSAGWTRLREFLGAWVVARSDEGLGYQTGFHLLAATALLNMPSPAAWLMLRNLMVKSGVLRAYYDPRRQAERDAYSRVLETLCSDPLPKVYYNLLSNSIHVPDSWFMTLFAEQLNLNLASRVWDQLLLEGDGFIFRTCIAILQTLSYRLYDPDPQALRGVLAGTAPVVLPLARKAGATAEEIKVEEGVWRAGGGRIYGIEEAGLMACLREGEVEWKEGSFQRLVQRELDSAV